MSDLGTATPILCAKCGREIPLPGQFLIRGVDRYHVGCSGDQRVAEWPAPAAVEVEITRLRGQVEEGERRIADQEQLAAQYVATQATGMDELAARAETAENRIAELASALARFGVHRDGCVWKLGRDHGCTCGLNAALSQAVTADKEGEENGT